MEWLGHFHPLIVHLPIGILLLAILFEWLILFQPWKKLEHSISIMLLLGTLGAWLACLTGYLLSLQGEYAGIVAWHQWLSISVALISTVYWFGRERFSADMSKLISITLLVLISITGHLGGTLTHGDDYLFASAKAEKEIDLANAYYYEDVVKPILESKCVSCHGANKQKGKLRLDKPSFIQAGGKHGAVLVSNQPDASDMIKRLLLPMDNEDHMPPSEKPQLKKEEIELLQDWIATGATFDRKFSEVSQMKSGVPKEVEDKLPEVNVSAASPIIVQKLQQLGVTITPLSAQTNFLQIALTNATISDSLFQNLLQIKEQIVWLKADNPKFDNQHLKQLIQLPNLTKLWLLGSRVNDEGLSNFVPNKNLRYLNLTGLKITKSGVESVLKKSNLNRLFIYQTNISSDEVVLLSGQFKSVLIEGGGYKVLTLETDTVEVKPSSLK
jgi:uncharacterized membrane protein/mono/diheme cytochrome c family protein